jgi:hypothetical protein
VDLGPRTQIKKGKNKGKRNKSKQSPVIAVQDQKLQNQNFLRKEEELHKDQKDQKTRQVHGQEKYRERKKRRPVEAILRNISRHQWWFTTI